MNEIHPIDRVLKLLEITMEALGEKLGVTKGAVSQWKSEGRNVPASHCPEIEKLTSGQVKCEELNSDVDWAYLRTVPELPHIAE